MERTMKYFSTFTGIGGFELGIQQSYETTKLQGDRSTRPTHEGKREGYTIRKGNVHH